MSKKILLFFVGCVITLAILVGVFLGAKVALTLFLMCGGAICCFLGIKTIEVCMDTASMGSH